MCFMSDPPKQQIPPPPPKLAEAPVPPSDDARVSIDKDPDKKRKSTKGRRGTILTDQSKSSSLSTNSGQSNVKTLLGQ